MADAGVGWSENGRSATEQDIFRLFCCVKPLVAICLAQLVDEGTLELSQPLSTWIPAFRGPGRDLVTPYHLLTHTSGLPNNRQLRGYDRPYVDIVRSACRRPIDRLYRPGERAEYNFVSAWHLLAHLVAVVSGSPLDKLVVERVSTPCAAASLTMIDPDPHRLTAPHARTRPGSFRSFPDLAPDLEHRSWLNPSDGGFGSARDVGLILSELLLARRGRSDLLAEPTAVDFTSLKRSGQFDHGRRRVTDFGLGFITGFDDAQFGASWGPTTFGHDASIGGHLLMTMLADPARDAVVVLRAFSFSSDSANHMRRLGAALFDDLHS